MATNGTTTYGQQVSPGLPSEFGISPTAGFGFDYELAFPVRILQANGTSADSPEVRCQLYSFLINVVVIGTVCVVGLFGNVFLYLIFHMDKRKISMTFFFKALSVVDSVLLICTFFLYSAVTFHGYTGLMPGFDALRPFVFAYVYPCACAAQTVVIWITTVVGINRYIAVCRPHRAAQLCKLSQAKKQVALVGSFSILYNLPKWFEAEIRWTSADNGTYTASVVQSAFGKNPLYKIVYSNVCYSLFLLCVPLCILCVVSLRILHQVRAVSRRRRAMRSSGAQLNHNVTFVLVIVFFVFIICQMPAVVNQVLWNALPDGARYCGGLQFYFSRISNALIVLNSALNFFVHVTLNKEFRERFLKLCASGGANQDSHQMRSRSRLTSRLTLLK